MSRRSEKVASVIKRVITQPITNLASEHSAGLVTVTSVKLSEDLQIAKIYISIYGSNISPAKFLAILEEKKGSIRSFIGSHLKVRFTPDVRFFLDDTLDQMGHIQELLDSVKKESKNINYKIDDYDEKSLPKT